MPRRKGEKVLIVPECPAPLKRELYARSAPPG